MNNPWNGKAVLEAFWWNCYNGAYRFDWYTYLAKLAPRLSAMGFDGIWTPPPCKDTNARNNTGYTPYDYGNPPVKQQSGRTTPNVPLSASFKVAQEGSHPIQARLSKPGTPPARVYIKVDYLGPASSTLF